MRADDDRVGDVCVSAERKREADRDRKRKRKGERKREGPTRELA